MRVLRPLLLLAATALVAGTAFGAGVAVANHQFSDVSSVSPFHGDVSWASDHAIAGGFPDGRFLPREPINRQQAARWFRRYNARLTVVTETVNPPAQTAFQGFAACPAGSRPVAGGARSSANNLFLASSAIDGVNNGWRAYWATPNGTTVDPSEITVHVLCAPGL